MLRKLCFLLLILLCSLGAVRAQDTSTQSPSPTLTRSQLAKQRDLLLRYGTRLQIVQERYGVVDRLLEVATPEQEQAIQSLRISPSQAMDLIKVAQDNMPEGELTDEAWKEFRRKIQPRFEDILGSDQFDVLLELPPSAQQVERLKDILAQAANTPEGQAAYQASNDLSASLTDSQRKFLQPFLDLAKPSTSAAALTPVAEAPSTSAVERRLVYLKRTSLGDIYAETDPSYIFVDRLPHRYRVEGGNPAVLAAVSNESGYPVRILGSYEGDVLKVADTKLLGPPPVMALSGGGTIWRGRLPARVVSTSPPTVELDLGRGQTITAELDFSGNGQAEFARYASAPFLVEGTCMVFADKTTLSDLKFFPWDPPQAPFQMSALLQASEEFLQSAADEYLDSHPDKFSGSSRDISFQVDQIGVTMQGCQPGQVRLCGRASLAHSGLTVLQGDFEAVAQVSLVKDNVQIKPVPGSLMLRATYPVYAVAPSNWMATLEKIMGNGYLQGSSVALPQDFRDKLTKAGILEATQIDQMQLFTAPAQDRRLGLLALAAPAASPTAAANVLKSRIQNPGELAVALTDETINAALRKKIPEMLPILRDIPEDLQAQGGVKLTQVEIPELDLAYSAGTVLINNCVINVHWSYGIFGGVEPGVRLKGSALLGGGGEPFKVTAKLKVDQMDFLSTRITEMPADEQQKLKDKLLSTLQDRNWELEITERLAIPALGPRAALVPTSLKGTATPAELLFQGRLDP
ncbi:hypothetical protein DYH09_24685 [bacterium CPR1]|nr:hypothetical protein [bacterium CPR1]